jgi:hypothetical protein
MFIDDLVVHKSKLLNEDVENFFSDHFQLTNINILLEKIKKFIKEMQDDLWIYMEFPYVDKVYRSSYYDYYSSKHKEYIRDCIRLSFFDREMNLDDFYSNEKHNSIKESFMGYLILRPTPPQFIGRNFLSPKVLKKHDFECCLARDEAEIKGLKLEIDGFPHESQDTEFSTCAETAIWSLVEYYSHKYHNYKPILLSDIVKALHDKANERMIPSEGLTSSQITWVLKKAGLETKIYSIDNRALFEKCLKPKLLSYIDSGIPLIGALSFDSESIGHAIVIIGRSKPDIISLYQRIKNLPIQFYNISSLEESCSIVVMDDNMEPFNVVPIENPTKTYGKDKSSSITEIFVPLYPKIYIDVLKADRIVKFFLNDSFQKIRKDVFEEAALSKPMLYRLLLASSRSFKHHICRLDIPNDLKEIIISIPMPKFIWLAELFDLTMLENDLIGGFLILDATMNFIHETIGYDSQFMCMYIDGKLSINSGNSWVEYQNCAKIHRYRNNLKGDWNLWKS